MANRLAANLFFLTHCAISLYALFGSLLITSDSLWLWPHVAVVLWIFSMNIANWTCPLTMWEQACRQNAVQPHSGGFVRRLLLPLLPGMKDSRRLEVAVGVSILLWNALLYVAIFATR